MTHQIVAEVADDVKDIISNGEQIRIKHYSETKTSNDYDNTVSLAQSGTDFLTSGILLPINEKMFMYNPSVVPYTMEQGRIKEAESVLYITGDVETTEVMKIGFGNPVDSEYAVIPKGVIAVPSHGTPTFKKVYVKYLPTGSLTGE